MLQIYDRVLGARSEETLLALFLLVAVLYALMTMLDFARGRILARFGARFQSLLDDRVFDAVMKRSLLSKYRTAPATGLRNLETLQTLFTSPVMLALFDVPWTPLFLAAIFIFHPLMGWLAVAGGGVLIVLTLLNNFLTRRKTLKAQSASQQANSFADMARGSAEIVRAQGMGLAISDRWHVMRDLALDQTIRSSDWTGFFSAVTKSFRLFLQSAMLALGAYLTLRGEMTAGAMIAGSIMLGRALAPIEQSLSQWPLVQRASAGWKSLGELLEETPPDPATMKLPTPEAHVSLKDVTVYPPGSKLATLSNISFDLAPGEVLGIIGKSGSGKSTLAKILLGLWEPANGELRFGGATLDQYAVDDLGSFIGYLPQQVALFTGTIAENIARMSPTPNDEQVVEAAMRANAHEMILSLPDGYKTVVEGSDTQLSGGQRQRIALARAFYGDPVLLVLDEPNSALDSEGSEALNQAVRGFKDTNRAVIIMTHRPMAISECDRLIVIDQGHIKAEGPRDVILKSMIKNAKDVGQTIARRSVQ